MTLEEIRNAAREINQAQHNLVLVEISRRKTIIFVKLDKLGIQRGHGWELTEEDPSRHGVWVSHPDLPNPALVILSGDSKADLYISQGGAGSKLVSTAWEIAQEMGATL